MIQMSNFNSLIKVIILFVFKLNYNYKNGKITLEKPETC